jgi:WD40 repeat protein
MGRRCVLGPESPLLGQNSPFLTSSAGTLELKSEKANAHSSTVTSVAFSPDGKTIVSGSYDETIKVWDAGAFWARNRPSLAETDRSRLPLAATLELKAEKTNAHDRIINSVAFSPDGTKIVSACAGGTIKVWDAGVNSTSNRPSVAKSDACWLAWQLRWS